MGKCEVCNKNDSSMCNCVQMVIGGIPIDFYLCSECTQNIGDSLNTSLYYVVKNKVLEGLKELAYRREN